MAEVKTWSRHCVSHTTPDNDEVVFVFNELTHDVSLRIHKEDGTDTQVDVGVQVWRELFRNFAKHTLPKSEFEKFNKSYMY